MSTLNAQSPVKNHRQVEEIPSVCISGVGTGIAKLKPLAEKVKNKKQGSLDINTPTCKSRFSWCLQLSLQLKIVTVGDAQNILVKKKIIEMKEDKVPKEFDPANLNNLFVDQFFTWDEFHREVIPGSDDGYVCNPYKDHIIKFPHNENGKLDVSNRTYSREKVTFTKCKYTDKVCMCLSVAIVTPVGDGVEQPQEGRRCKPFVYAGKTLLSMTDFENKVQNEIVRVKGLKEGQT